MATERKLFLHDHPVSSYAQKVRIALREKGIPFDNQTPSGLGSGSDIPGLGSANPRLEVPALEDGDLKLFDSTVILGYLEDKYPDRALLPKDPAMRAKARMIEEVCDTEYEAVNWGLGEVIWMQRATGELADKIKQQAARDTSVLQDWLLEKLDGQEYFNGPSFGYADVCVAPMLNRSFLYELGPAEGSPLHAWHARIKQRESIKQTFAEMEDGTKVMSTKLKDAFKPGAGGRREYRDHRLEFMIRSGGIDVVLDGLRDKTIRFSWPHPM